MTQAHLSFCIIIPSSTCTHIWMAMTCLCMRDLDSGELLAACLCRTLWELLRGRVVPKASRRWGGFFHNDAEHRDFTAIGTAAGMTPPTSDTIAAVLCCAMLFCWRCCSGLLVVLMTYVVQLCVNHPLTLLLLCMLSWLAQPLALCGGGSTGEGGGWGGGRKP